ncbi:hypothetical protein C8D77_101251 [Mesorhizobium loti]|uniref:Uncharacterized protein n=2 Tax=Rhizobium loti TaxID=381 RepID=A0A8E2WGK1_RHILI|nr:hypothetical protein C8D77_101251 [Mesorhizobium loti]
MRNADLETSSASLENLTKAHSGPTVGGGGMSRVAIAFSPDDRAPRDVIRAVGELLLPKTPARLQYGKIYSELCKRVPTTFARKVTPRRVRAIYNDDARRVEWYEMKALLEIEALEEARRARLELAATANRLAALIAAEDAALDGEERRELGRLAGALDRAGIKADGGVAR